MNTYKDIIYLILDELRGDSDDFSFSEEHILYLISKYRALILKQRYSDIKKQIPSSNYQTICLNLEVDYNKDICDDVTLRSTVSIPDTMLIGNPKVYPIDYYGKVEIAFISKERMRYIGYNKYLKNIIYCSIGPDNRLYLASSNPQYQLLQKVKFTAVFQDSEAASELSCDENSEICDILDKTFPLEDALIPVVVELVIKELRGAFNNPTDNDNNASDDIKITSNARQSQYSRVPQES